MARPVLEVADIFRDHGPAWRCANAGHVSLGQMKVMSAIESCRTAALGGHVVRCEDCSHIDIAYNSCRNRHCPKCQGAQARAWLEERKAELLGVPYFHVVFTLPARIAAIAYQNKTVIYDLLFKASSETLRTIAARAGVTNKLAADRRWSDANFPRDVRLRVAALQERINLAALFAGQMEIAFGHCPSVRFAVPRKDSLHLTARKPAYTTRQSVAGETVSLKGARCARIASGD